MLVYGPYITAYMLVLALVLGSVIGSFVNCWAWRYLNGESVAKGRSHCTTCGHALSARDLVPIVSWAVSKGRCRYCGAKISIRYPLSEAACALAFAGIVLVYGLSIETIELLAFAGVLLFLSLTDIDEFLIPNGAILTAIGIRIVFIAISLAMGDMSIADAGYYVASAFGMGVVLLAIVLVADRVFGRESMGGGDLKLYFVAGLYFGWQQGIFLVLVSCIIGIIVGPLRSEKSTSENKPGVSGAHVTQNVAIHHTKPGLKPFPFGPSIAVACIITMLVGNQVVSWYLTML